ncbi:hypothetical protein FQR65_LT03460 [Abscondita terminalis]|nr:hypothetical protein FQR65_LT03460 [Abscondita terminalis]
MDDRWGLANHACVKRNFTHVLHTILFLKQCYLNDNSELNNPDSYPDSEVIGQANAGGSNLKDYSGKVKEVTEDSQYVKLDLENGKTAVIKESTYCWLLEEERDRVSSLRRFIGSSKAQSKTRSKQFKRNKIQNEKASKKERSDVTRVMFSRRGRHGYIT